MQVGTYDTQRGICVYSGDIYTDASATEHWRNSGTINCGVEVKVMKLALVVRSRRASSGSNSSSNSN